MKTTPTTLTRGGHDASVTVTSQTIPTVNRKFDFQDAFTKKLIQVLIVKVVVHT